MGSFFNDASVQALRNGLDAAWMRQQISSHNIANSETPGFKAKSVSFKKVLDQAQSDADTKVYTYEPVIKTDDTASIRPDGNNVNTEKEELELWDAYYQYSALTKRVTGNLSTLRYVIQNTGK